ncbi:hypothetical protein [Massilia sp. ZL223]|uniref:hypothetical protein n=1 Tax=Massilia sp. ZL223 TaxID=2824904 RepID=UPI001B834542|nr:hypothetical protein [Massilia sp. ZL223]MBQ5965447.1 hypothetical protein [Massilia sp. ZL223]
MTRIHGYGAYPQVQTSGDTFNINSGIGLPVLLFYCEICGYVESYVGPKTGYWDLDHPSPSIISPEQFETVAFDALQSASEILKISNLRRNVRLRFPNGQDVEYDAIAESNAGVVIFEVKSTASRHHIESGAAQLSRLIALYRKNSPETPIAGAYLVIPAMSNANIENLSFPVLKVNPSTSTIINLGETL